MKYSLSPREIPRASPSGSGYISQYIPSLVTIQIQYVSKNIEINQEFKFSAAKTRLEINSIYNSSWYGSTLWNLFGADSIKIESSYNRSIKYSMNLPYSTHRYLIEPLSERRHLKWLLISRFLDFMTKIVVFLS